MKKDTIEILKNFSTINQGIRFRPGNTLKTMSLMKNSFAEATISEEIKKDFAIYDLNEFLASLSLFDNPETVYNSDHVEIREGKTRIKYFYSNPSVVISPPEDKKIKVDADLTFNITGAALSQLLKAANVLRLSELEISATGLRVFNKSSVGNQYDVTVDNLKADEGVAARVVKIENIKVIPGDYKVESSERAVKFTSVSGDLSYIIAVESE